jgi:hypothetical protein
MAKGRLLPHRSSTSKRMSTDEEDVGLLLLLRGRRHARRHYRGDRLVVAYTPRAREDVRPSRLSREVLRALWSPTLHAQRAVLWEMQPLPLFDSTAGYPASSSSVRAQGPVAMANQKGQKAPREAIARAFPMSLASSAASY